jgi:RNA polymerase primary sigma factor
VIPHENWRADDTTLDSLAAQVRSFPPLPLDEISRLLLLAKEHPQTDAQEQLVNHHLSIALKIALTRQHEGIEVFDVYQEASIAIVVAIAEYVSRGGDAQGLHHYVERVVNSHLDTMVKEFVALKTADESFVREVSLLQTAAATLRSKLKHEPTATELAAVLNWSPPHVEFVAHIVADARDIYDEEILEYLDDE